MRSLLKALFNISSNIKTITLLFIFLRKDIRKVVLKSMHYVLMLSLSRPCLFVGCLSYVKLLKVQWQCKCSRFVFNLVKKGKPVIVMHIQTQARQLYIKPSFASDSRTDKLFAKEMVPPWGTPICFLDHLSKTLGWRKAWDVYALLQYFPALTNISGNYCIRDKLSHGSYCF